jgi:hypothetical protein
MKVDDRVSVGGWVFGIYRREVEVAETLFDQQGYGGGALTAANVA